MSAQVLLRDDPHVNWEDGSVEFRLTYQGPLLSETQRNSAVRGARAEHKHRIRKVFHGQLKRWWEISPYLKPRPTPPNALPNTRVFGRPSPQHSIEGLSQKFDMFGYNFVPLVTRDLELFCAIEILYLRHGDLGKVLSIEGDIDNRLKTLFDSLSMPRDKSQLGPFLTPDHGEVPFFCLLEDDSVITKASVESDVLLRSSEISPDPNDSSVVITVRIRPARVSSENVGFA